jgi:hypothetical protein
MFLFNGIYKLCARSIREFIILNISMLSYDIDYFQVNSFLMEFFIIILIIIIITVFNFYIIKFLYY